MNLSRTYLIAAGFLLLSLRAFTQSSTTCGDTCQCYVVPEVIISQRTDPNYAHLIRHHQLQALSSIDDMLARLPGISLVRRGAYANEPMLRGLNTNQVALTIDGMRVFEACTDKMDPISAYVEPNNLRGIEVSAGPQGTSYGNTTGGNLNFQLRKANYADSIQWNGFTSARIQTADRGLSQRSGIAYSSPRLGTRLNVVYRNSGAYRSGFGQSVPYSQFEKLNYASSTRIRLTDQKELLVDILGDHAWNVGYTALPMDVAFAHALMGSLTYRQRARQMPWLRWEAKVYANRVDHSMDDSNRDSVIMRMDMPGLTRTAGAWWKGQLLIDRSHLIEVKTDAYINRSYAEMTMYPKDGSPMFMLTWPNVHRSSVGISLQDQYQISRNWQLMGAIRAEHNHTTMRSELGTAQLEIFFPTHSGQAEHTLLNGKIALKGKPHANWKLEGLISYGERAPSISELFGYYLFNRMDGYDYLGNPELGIESCYQGEISTTYLGKRVQVKWTGYTYFFQDYIQAQTVPAYSAMTIGATGVRQYEHLPTARLIGTEATFLWNPTPYWQLLITSQYTLGQDHLKRPLPLISPWQVRPGIRYRRGGTMIQATANWQARQNRIRSDFGEDPTPSFVVLDSEVRQQLPLQEQTLEITMGIENILDQGYWQHLDWGNVPRPGRNVYAGLALRW